MVTAASALFILFRPKRGCQFAVDTLGPASIWPSSPWHFAWHHFCHIFWYHFKWSMSRFRPCWSFQCSGSCVPEGLLELPVVFRLGSCAQLLLALAVTSRSVVPTVTTIWRKVGRKEGRKNTEMEWAALSWIFNDVPAPFLHLTYTQPRQARKSKEVKSWRVPIVGDFCWVWQRFEGRMYLSWGSVSIRQLPRFRISCDNSLVSCLWQQLLP